MRQLPNRWTATAQNPGSRKLAPCVRKSSSRRLTNEMPEGFSFVAPRGRGGGSRIGGALVGPVIDRLGRVETILLSVGSGCNGIWPPPLLHWGSGSDRNPPQVDAVDVLSRQSRPPARMPMRRAAPDPEPPRLGPAACGRQDALTRIAGPPTAQARPGFFS